MMDTIQAFCAGARGLGSFSSGQESHFFNVQPYLGKFYHFTKMFFQMGSNHQVDLVTSLFPGAFVKSCIKKSSN